MDALIVAAAFAGSIAALERYRPTTKGANPWSIEGLLNVLAFAPYFERAAELVGGRFSSVYRSERVNTLVGGSPASDHLHGRAVDLIPSMAVRDRDAWIRESAAVLKAAADRGELGPVREILIEPGCVHIGWRPLDEQTAKAARLGTWGFT